jgi:conjugative relaxase-like TrwC/TraI family protein
VLRLAKLTDAEYVLRQVAGGLEDYYLGSGEAPGVWSGRLAGQVGLAGVVEADGLRALIDRRHPATGEALGGGKQPTVRAVDATFSAPKSVSLLWAFAGPEVASVISIAHVEAVEAALGFVEKHAAVTRRQVRGVRTRARTSGWAAATFVHRTSRAGDPQIHTHAVIPNLVQREDGQWVAIDATGLYRWAKAAGSVYQEQLRRLLSQRLGVAWGPDRNGCREMVGISEAQLRAFSKRTAQIEDHLAATGVVPGDAKARMQADEAASVATRPAKDPHLTPERLRGRWEAEAAAVGLPTGEALLEAVRNGAQPSAGIARRDVGELFDRFTDPELGLCAHDSRFGQAQVVEAVAAWGAGRLRVSDINALTHRFLHTDRVIRLINPDPSGRAPGQWSTVAHRRLEDRVLDSLVVLQQRQAPAVDPSAVKAAVADASELGGDQAEAVEGLCAAGPALRALISPAGHGKTTTLAAATDAARRAGRPVLAVSTTNQAVDQLRQVGIEAVTVARFARSGAELAPGTVVVVDEFSQLPTREALTILAAAAGCPDSLVWMLGDPLQAQPVGAGGLAQWIAEEARQGRIPVAELRVNRRQADPVERQALTRFRAGQITHSQDLRDQAGWEHHHSDRDQALAAMAAAVLADIDIHGADRVAALAVSHADCEALSDRIRVDLADQGVIAGPALKGPGWAGPRDYQAGDRIILHTHAYLDDAGRIVNGTVATVCGVGPAGLTVTTERQAQLVLLPAGFVTARGADGRPQLSHAWARTIDGVQGGTWDQVHLLATPALDRYRGYVGQSRSICPTHTWNTTPRLIDDHGGKLVQAHSTPAEQIAAALARAQPKTFAAADDPYRHERAVRAEQKAHDADLARRPVDVSGDLETAEQTIRVRQRDLDDAKGRLAHWQAQYERTAGLRALTRAGRDQHRGAARQIDFQTGVVGQQAQRLNAARRQRDDLLRQQAAGTAFDQTNQWRHDSIEALDAQLKLYWTQAVLDAARDGHPAAYGKARLQAARHTLIEQIENLASGPAPSQPQEPVGAIADPLLALRDLDRAIKQAAEQPALRLVEPVRSHRHQALSEVGLDIHQQHQAYQQLYQPGPSIGIDL